MLRVNVIGSRSLLAKDRSTGSSDPFVDVHLHNKRRRTNVLRCNLNPEWNTIFDLPVPNSPLPPVLKCIVWDKDRIGKEFLGQVIIPLIDLQPRAGYSALDSDETGNPSFWYPLEKRSRKSRVSGELCLRIGWLAQTTDEVLALPLWKTLVRTGEPINNLLDQENEEDDEEEQDITESTTDEEVSEDSPSSSETSLVPSKFALGLLALDIVKAENLPKNKSFVPARFDMDPFVIVSLGTKVFKTRVIRHTTSPVWNERVYFDIKDDTPSNSLKLSIYDFDTMTNNDFIATTSIKAIKLLETSSIAQEKTLSMELKNTKTVSLTIKWSYKTYAELRVTFLKKMAMIYDNDQNSQLNFIELQATLEQIGFGNIDKLVDTMYDELQKTHMDEISIEEFVSAIETNVTDSIPTGLGKLLEITQCPFCRRVLQVPSENVSSSPKQKFLGSKLKRRHKYNYSNRDALTHLAICASSDSNMVENSLIGGYLTEEYAQRKFLSKFAAYLSFGSYSAGKNNAHILVHDRLTGQMIEEKMPTYIRLGIRLLYQTGAAVDSKLIKKLLKDMSVRQGVKYNDPISTRYIPKFVTFHKINVEEAEEPHEGFKTFNEFFYRKLKPGARELASPDDPRVLVSPADCRMNAFESITTAQSVWVKGQAFSISSLLDDAEMAKKFEGGSMGIFRLAPQDYHRFHYPVNGTVLSTKEIQGTYFTVNPMAIRASHISVYTENIRIVTYLQSPEFGLVAIVAVGAMMVGSIHLTNVTPGTEVKRMDEHGYFAFGGSTVLVLFEQGKIQWDQDILNWSQKQKVETLVRVGMRLGCAANNKE